MNTEEFKTKYSKYIEEGVKLLNDKVGKYWIHKINLNHLDLKSGYYHKTSCAPCGCVLSQLNEDGSFTRMLVKLFPSDPKLDKNLVISVLRKTSVQYGFILSQEDLNDTEFSFYNLRWEILTDMWKEKILELRHERQSL